MTVPNIGPELPTRTTAPTPTDGRETRLSCIATNLWASTRPVIRRGRLQLDLPGRPVREFAEADYCYGVGPLTLKVDRIEWDRPVRHEGDTWLEVGGVVVDRAGREGARREVLVRAERLPLRPPRKRPRRRR
jgi:hypothetical protein